jgi:glycosyltransferase involved in cell wall biosynthesis
MRLAVVTTGLGVGGAETMLYKLLTRLDSKDFSVSVFSLLGDEVFAQRLRREGIAVHTAGLGTGSGGLHGLLRLRKAFVQFDPDLVQGWMYHGNLAALLLSWGLRRRRPVFWGIRQSLYSLRAEKRATAWLIRLCARLSSHVAGIVYNSSLGARHHEAVGFSKARSLVIPNGFDTSLFQPSAARRRGMRESLGFSEQHLVVALVGRHHPVKDHAGFLAAATRVSAAVPAARFVMVGTDIDQENKLLCAAIQRLSLQDKVLLLGERGDMENLFPSFDLLVSASLAEGFPNVVGEAMASAVPCVVTDVGNCAAIVGETGTVAPPGDPQSLADAIIRLLLLPKARRSFLGQEARARVCNQFSIEAIVKAYASMYAKQLGAGR